MELWIARDTDGELKLDDQYPIEMNGWFSPQRGYETLKLDEEMFPEITFKNSPRKVKIELVWNTPIQKKKKR